MIDNTSSFSYLRATRGVVYALLLSLVLQSVFLILSVTVLLIAIVWNDYDFTDAQIVYCGHVYELWISFVFLYYAGLIAAKHALNHEWPCAILVASLTVCGKWLITNYVQNPRVQEGLALWYIILDPLLISMACLAGAWRVRRLRAKEATIAEA